MAHAASQLKKRADVDLNTVEDEKEKKRKLRKRSRELKKKVEEERREERGDGERRGGQRRGGMERGEKGSSGRSFRHISPSMISFFCPGSSPS